MKDTDRIAGSSRARMMLALSVAVCLVTSVRPANGAVYFTETFGGSTKGTFLENFDSGDTSWVDSAATEEWIGADSDTTDLHGFAGGHFNTWDNHYGRISFDSGRAKYEFLSEYRYGFVSSYYLRQAQVHQSATEPLDFYRSYVEKDEMYLSWSVEFASDWNSWEWNHGGKLLGVAGTRTHGAGGEQSDGTNGWSARVQWFQDLANDDSLFVMGYLYHKNQPDEHGHEIPARTLSPRIAKGEKYDMKIYVKLNTPSSDDGEFRLWIDDQLRIDAFGDTVFTFTSNGTSADTVDLGSNSIQYSDDSDIQINRVWAGLYYGGEYDVFNTSYIWIDDVKASDSATKPVASGDAFFSVPSRVELDQNAPNPFNPSTAIRYSLDAPASVDLRVLNILGQEVRALVQRRQSPGQYVVHWNGRDDNDSPAGSGVYLLRLEVDGVVQTKKMALTR